MKEAEFYWALFLRTGSPLFYLAARHPLEEEQEHIA